MTFGNFLSPNIAAWPFDKRKADDENEERDRAEEHGEGVWPGAHRQQLSVCASQRAPFIINNLPAPWSTDPVGRERQALRESSVRKELPVIQVCLRLACPPWWFWKQSWSVYILSSMFRMFDPPSTSVTTKVILRQCLFFYRTQVRSFPWLISMPPKMRLGGSLHR